MVNTTGDLQFHRDLLFKNTLEKVRTTAVPKQTTLVPEENVFFTRPSSVSVRPSSVSVRPSSVFTKPSFYGSETTFGERPSPMMKQYLIDKVNDTQEIANIANLRVLEASKATARLSSSLTALSVGITIGI